MNLSDYLSEKTILFSLESTNKKQAVRSLLKVLKDNSQVQDEEMAFSDIMARENHLSTGMENGLAIPHAKTDAVQKLVVAFGIHRKGLDYDSLDGKPAHYIFLVLSPRDTSGPHIQALARISRSIKNENLREALLQAKDKKEILNIFSHIQPT